MSYRDQEAGQRPDGHMVRSQAYRALSDHHGPLRFVNFQVLEIVNTVGGNIQRLACARLGRDTGLSPNVAFPPGKRNRETGGERDEDRSEAGTEALLHLIHGRAKGSTRGVTPSY